MTVLPKHAPTWRTTDGLLLELAELEPRLAANAPARDLIERARVRIKLLVGERDGLATALKTALARLDDVLAGDDGQAFKEAERAVPALKDALTRFSA